MTPLESETVVNISGDNGVRKEILVEGEGSERPRNGYKVSLHYTGKLTDGTIFDSSVNRGQQFEFIVGKYSVIKAFDLGVLTMKLGEKCRLICEPSYAYGQAGFPPNIPPNSTLIFELLLLGWRGEDISPKCDGSIEKFFVKSGEKKRRPNEGALVKAHITGKYEDNIFDVRDVEFDLGEGSNIGIIYGVEKAIEQMAVGEISRFKINSKHAYGSEGNVEFSIPPNSTVEYTIQLNDFEDFMGDRQYTIVELFEKAQIYKEKGTKYFKKQNYSLAIKMYKKCITIAENHRFDIDSNLRVAAYSNQALCYQKTNDEFKGILMCNKALQIQPWNIKLLYRRGQYNLVIKAYNQALEDFQNVLRIDPGNKAAQNQLQILKRKLKETTHKEIKMYANMFAKFVSTDKEQEIPNETDTEIDTEMDTETDAVSELM